VKRHSIVGLLRGERLRIKAGKDESLFSLECLLLADFVAKVRNTPADRNLIEWCFSRDDFRQI